MLEETNLTQEELEALQPQGLKVVNPWIYKQTHVETLQALRVSKHPHENSALTHSVAYLSIFNLNFVFSKKIIIYPLSD